MISADYCRLMACYNEWQNMSLVTAADTLTDAERHLDRGAFFGSIAATFNHLYWADALILERLRGNERPHERVAHSLTSPEDWFEFKALRAGRDEEVQSWAQGLKDADLAGQVGWHPPDGGAKVEMAKALCAVQLFNHQTHHRGQIHAMLTAAGARPGVTDIPLKPDVDFN